MNQGSVNVSDLNAEEAANAAALDLKNIKVTVEEKSDRKKRKNRKKSSKKRNKND